MSRYVPIAVISNGAKIPATAMTGGMAVRKCLVRLYAHSVGTVGNDYGRATRIFDSVEEDLEIEVDLHGGRTELARDLRTLIIATKLQLDQ